MPSAFSLRVFMPQGEPQGLRIVEKTNWTGVGIIFPRNRVDKARARESLQRTGVYVLWSNDDQLRPKVYVGQSENVARRVRQHFDNEDMDWCTTAAAFTTKDDAFNQGHARFLEWALIQRARLTNRGALKNQLEPSKPSISEPDQVDAEHFLDDLLQCLPLAGLDCFEDTRTRASEGVPEGAALRLHLDKPGIGVRATAVPGVAEFTVLKGALVRKDEDLAPGFGREHPGYVNLRQQLIQDGVIGFNEDGEFLLKEDWSFRSPSEANVVITGGPMSPYVAWVDGAGRTWREILDASSESVDE